jgi:hypothetical protein
MKVDQPDPSKQHFHTNIFGRRIARFSWAILRLERPSLRSSLPTFPCASISHSDGQHVHVHGAVSFPLPASNFSLRSGQWQLGALAACLRIWNQTNRRRARSENG